MIHNVKTSNFQETLVLAKEIGNRLRGGEVFNLISDLGGGKTAFVRGLTEGFGSTDPVASPTFTISFSYSRPDGKRLHHYDFYRLDDPGIIARELAEATSDPDDVVAVEWSDIVKNVLPKNTIKVTLKVLSEEERAITFDSPKELSYLFDKLK